MGEWADQLEFRARLNKSMFCVACTARQEKLRVPLAIVGAGGYHHDRRGHQAKPQQVTPAKQTEIALEAVRESELTFP